MRLQTRDLLIVNWVFQEVTKKRIAVKRGILCKLKLLLKKEILMGFQVDLIFRSFEPESLAKALETARKIINIYSPEMDLRVIGVQKKNRRWTLLRSPHVHKKSREQFEMPTHQAILKTSWQTQEEIKIFWLALQNSEVYGVQIRVEINSSMHLNSIKKENA